MKYLSKEKLNRLRADERKNISCYVYWFSVNVFDPATIRTLEFSDPLVKIYSHFHPMYIIFETTNNFLKMDKK